jgi:serine/threonine-protein kinase
VAAPAALEGRTLGEFLVKERIGAGGFGAVYRAEQTLLGREAVIKVMHPEHQAQRRLEARFLREARLASLLDHPYAAHIYSFGAEPDGLLWIAMERVRGTTLADMLQAAPLPLAKLVPLLERIAQVVQAAHEQRIVHRDLKPSNVMVVTRAGELYPKLLDFGIAKLRLVEGSGDEAAPPTRPTAPTAPTVGDDSDDEDLPPAREAEAVADTMPGAKTPTPAPTTPSVTPSSAEVPLTIEGAM